MSLSNKMEVFDFKKVQVGFHGLTQSMADEILLSQVKPVKLSHQRPPAKNPTVPFVKSKGFPCRSTSILSLVARGWGGRLGSESLSGASSGVSTGGVSGKVRRWKQ